MKKMSILFSLSFLGLPWLGLLAYLILESNKYDFIFIILIFNILLLEVINMTFHLRNGGLVGDYFKSRLSKGFPRNSSKESTYIKSFFLLMYIVYILKILLYPGEYGGGKIQFGPVVPLALAGLLIAANLKAIVRK